MRYLARAWVSGELRAAGLEARAAEVLGQEWEWVAGLAARFEARFAAGTRPRMRDAVDWLVDDRGLRLAWRRHGAKLRVVERIAGAAEMRPVEAASAWEVPAIRTEAELAEWLGVGADEVAWFAGMGGVWGGHYEFRWMAKRTGGMRLIEAPKVRLKTVQRKILAGILDCVPAHPAVHGYVRGRSVRSFAGVHVGQEVLLRMDLQDFFPSVRRTRVQAMFRTMGYPERVADALGGMVTVATPRSVLRGALAEMREVYGASHLPQGAPSSPAIANMCGYRMDCRLEGLAEAAGGRYTRYADDLAFSGGREFARGLERFAAHVGAVVAEEGMAVNFRKTKVMGRGVRQCAAGVVVNERLGTGRAEFDALKAVLHGCRRDGVEVANREGRAGFREHLEGKVAWVASVNEGRGEKLRKMLRAIDW